MLQLKSSFHINPPSPSLNINRFGNVRKRFVFYFANQMKPANFHYMSKVWFTAPYGSVFSETTLSGERTDCYLTSEQFKTLNEYANSPKHKACFSSMNYSTYNKCLTLYNTPK